jgi:tetratricopeptide (TPR) repeat protein
LTRGINDKSSPTLDYEETKRDRLCEQILKLKNDLTDEDKIKLSRISILLYPLEDYQMLAEYLQINNNDAADIIVIPFIERLIERGIFDKNYKWFRHQVIKKCFEADLEEGQRKRYHNRAADFYLELLEELPRQPKEKEDQDSYDDNRANSNDLNRSMKRGYEISIECANHLHAAGRHNESYTYNEGLSDYASKTIGDLDLAERCYKMAIDDAEKLGNLENKMRRIHNLSWSVYYVWGRYDEALDKYHSILKYYEDHDSRLLNVFCLLQDVLMELTKVQVEPVNRLSLTKDCHDVLMDFIEVQTGPAKQ